MAEETFKSFNSESSLIDQRLKIAIFTALLLVFGLLIRMYCLQIVEYKKFTTLSNDNRILIQPVPPLRGRIYDDSGHLIATNTPGYTLSIVPERVPSLEETLNFLKKIITISADDLKYFHRMLKQRPPFESIPLKYRLTQQEMARIAVDQYRLPGVEIQAQFIRYYPYNNLFSSVVGYVGRINDQEQKKLDPSLYRGTHIIGKTGIEYYYENVLLGKVGYREAETDVRGRVRRILKEEHPVKGRDLHLYINLELQKAVFEAMKGQQGAVVAIDPNTGGILAMVSTPTFNPNLFVTGISYKEYNALNNDPARPLFNRTTLGEYPPASTIKPIMALAALDSQKVTSEWTIFDPGYYQLPGFKHKYRNWKKDGQGSINLYKAIVKSNDTYFYNIAVKLGIDNIHKYTSMFGYGVRPDIDFFPVRGGLMPSPLWKKNVYHKPWYPGETVISGIGQGYMQVTPLQMAAAVAIIANKGKSVTPRIARPDADTPPVKPAITISSEKKWQPIIKAMQDAMSIQGTGWRMGTNNFTVAGKTGTAQVINIPQGERYNPKKLKQYELDHGLFIGFSPVQKPQIAIAVVAENQSKVAVAIARKIFQAYFDQQGKRAASVTQKNSAENNFSSATKSSVQEKQ
ncbi:MAG: penicillin-binding protein 2 [Endozoicomonadaceae bacterium]|nr:penicillin-binding protein 2 [Endozoicomonadaceae bacterium]